MRKPGETRFFERRPNEVFCRIYIKICVCSVNKFLKKQKIVSSNIKLCYQKSKKGKKEQKKKPFSARSDRAECVDIVNYS